MVVYENFLQSCFAQTVLTELKKMYGQAFSHYLQTSQKLLLFLRVMISKLSIVRNKYKKSKFVNAKY